MKVQVESQRDSPPVLWKDKPEIRIDKKNILDKMDIKISNNLCIKKWVVDFMRCEQNETDKHIDDILGFTIQKSEWIKTAIQIYQTIIALDCNIRAFVLVRQKAKNNVIKTVNTSQMRGIVMPPAIILYKEHQDSILFDDCIYSASISKQFDLPAYLHYDSDGECDVFLGGDNVV